MRTRYCYSSISLWRRSAYLLLPIEFCLQYLNFGCFDSGLTDPEICEFLCQGYYHFEDYAVAHWLDHVDSSTSHSPQLEAVSIECLVQRLESFFMKHGPESPPDLQIYTNDMFQSIRQWEFTRRLGGLAQLARERKSNEDHLDLETELQRRRLIYESTVTNLDPHGQNGRFKCPKRYCEFFYDGFPNREHRDKHVNQHERPFRCTFEECLHAELGYETQKDLKRHEKTSYLIDESSEWAFPTYKRKDMFVFSASTKGCFLLFANVSLSGWSEFPCLHPRCGHISSRAGGLKRHMTVHFPPSFGGLTRLQIWMVRANRRTWVQENRSSPGALQKGAREGNRVSQDR